MVGRNFAVAPLSSMCNNYCLVKYCLSYYVLSHFIYHRIIDITLSGYLRDRYRAVVRGLTLDNANKEGVAFTPSNIYIDDRYALYAALEFF